MHIHVGSEVDYLSIHLVTVRALELCRTSVHIRVNTEVSLSRECLVALPALIYVRTTVYPLHVLSERLCLSEEVLTLSALKGFLARVSYSVFLQTVWLGESLAALVTCIRSLAGVSSKVLFQVSLVVKGMLAFRALISFLIAVNHHVRLNSPRESKGFLT